MKELTKQAVIDIYDWVLEAKNSVKVEFDTIIAINIHDEKWRWDYYWREWVKTYDYTKTKSG